MNNAIEHWTQNIRFDAKGLGYVMLTVPPQPLPPVTYQGVEWIAKQELHCSLLCLPEVVRLSHDMVAAPALEDFVKAYIEARPITFAGFGDRLYVCANGEARSIIADVRVHGITHLFAEIRSAFRHLSELPDPAPHVTLYRYNHRYGIGIHNNAELSRLCRLILPTELKEVRKAIHEQV